MSVFDSVAPDQLIFGFPAADEWTLKQNVERLPVTQTPGVGLGSGWLGWKEAMTWAVGVGCWPSSTFHPPQHEVISPTSKWQLGLVWLGYDSWSYLHQRPAQKGWHFCTCVTASIGAQEVRAIKQAPCGPSLGKTLQCIAPPKPSVKWQPSIDRAATLSLSHGLKTLRINATRIIRELMLPELSEN